MVVRHRFRLAYFLAHWTLAARFRPLGARFVRPLTRFYWNPSDSGRKICNEAIFSSVRKLPAKKYAPRGVHAAAVDLNVFFVGVADNFLTIGAKRGFACGRGSRRIIHLWRDIHG